MSLRPLSLAAALAALAATPLATNAQTFPTDDPVLKRIWSIGMDSTWTYKLAQVLLDSIGPRLSGTPGQKRANDWVVKTYASWGIEARNEKVGTWRGWRRGHSHIDLIEPRMRTLEGTMLGWSPGTGGKDVTASTIILPRLADSAAYVRWFPNAKGKLVLVSAPIPTCRPNENWTARATPESHARIDSVWGEIQDDWRARFDSTGFSLSLGTGSLGVLLENAGAVGVLTSRPKDAWGTIEVFETYNTKAPAIGLSCEDYGLVYRLTENNQAPKIRLNLDAELLGEQDIFNTIGVIRGSEKPNEYVMLSAHFDSWDGGSGATDNGTGSLTMLEAMRILKQVYPRPKRTIMVGHWTAEENGLVGSRAFSEDHPEVVGGLQALFNQDNGTGRISRISGGGLPNAAEHMTQWYAKLPDYFRNQAEFGGVGSPGGGGSDHASFACHGAPTFGLGASNWDYGTYTWHTNRDTYDKVVFDDLKANATLTAMLVYLASEDATFVTRERIDLATAQRGGGGGGRGARGGGDGGVGQRFGRAGRAGRGGGGGGRGRGGDDTPRWPECQKAPRVTNPRM